MSDWLEKLGMAEYAKAFAENRIDVSVLPELTDLDLEKVGVVLGDRRKILRAIRERTGTSPSAQQPVLVEAKPQDTAERRQVTVMFSDLVGSTALSARMDPEDLREVITAYQKSVAETVQRFGGFVAKYMGDGVLVYFGYPQAHEDDAERAVRAGLELIQAVGGLKSGAPLQTRVGVATGLVVVGDLIGSGAAQEQTVVGETPNIAARLQGIAAPNTVVIAESTRKLLGNLFDLNDLGAQDLKGIGGQVRAWAALRPASVESRFEALHATGLTELVGREEELELLLRRWSKAKSGDGQVVLLSGEAGIGKSRLSAALLERLASEPHTRLRYFCSPQHTDSALYPIICQIERAAALARGDSPQTKLDKLDALLAQTSTSEQDAATFAEMLSLTNDGRYPVIELPPPVRRQRAMEALFSQVQVLTQQNPVLMIFEDAHWTDPSSLELFDRAVDRISSMRVLLVVAYRPEFSPPWIGRPHVTALTINRLTRHEGEALIDRVVGNKSLPANVRQDIIERTDGIPLFVEEMTKAVIEAGSEDAVQRTAAAIPSSALAVPASLQASLMARLDRLGQARDVAQIGAAIGREFSHPLLAAVARKPGRELDTALDRLIQAGLLFRQGVPPDATYVFKHALVQNAAYGTLLREPRRALHARIAETIEAQFPEIAESQPQLLARDCTEANLVEKAVALWGKAGQRSVQRSALVEALEQITQALKLIGSLPTTAALRQQEIKLQVSLITPLYHVKGWIVPETQAAVERARLLIEQAEALGEAPEDPLILFQVLLRTAVAKFFAFDSKASVELARQFLTLAEKQTQSVLRTVGHRLVGTALLYTGDFTGARVHYEKSIALYDPAEHRPFTTRFGHSGVESLIFRSVALWALGYPEQALAGIDQALRNAREIGETATLLIALTTAHTVFVLRRNYAGANKLTDEFFLLAKEKGTAICQIGAMVQRGCVLALTGKSSNTVDLFTSTIVPFRSTGVTAHMPFILSIFAYAHTQLGKYDDAWRCVNEAVALIESTGERWTEAETLRTAGEIALIEPKPDAAKAEAYFNCALDVARTQKAKSWELRAAMSMARLWRDQGKREEARELLAPVYGWFTEGFDTRDLKEAKALLDELAT
jgi:class 3 adenylate cyclase/predicted ATPase